MLSRQPPPLNPVDSECYRVGSLEVDVDARRVFHDGDEIHLTELSFDVLAVLLRRAPAIVSRKELMREVWPGLRVESETVTKRIALLRESLDDHDTKAPLVRVARGRGYAIGKPVDRIDDASTSVDRPSRQRLTKILALFVLVLSLVAIVVAVWSISRNESQELGTTERITSQAVPGTDRGTEPNAPLDFNELDPVAYQLYLEGKTLRRVSGDSALAADALSRAIDIEPRFAAAYAELALCRLSAPFLTAGAEMVELPGRSPGALAQQALRLDPGLPEAFAAAAAVAILVDWNWSESEALLEKGLMISPGHEYLLAYRSLLAQTRGDLDEAIRLMKLVVAHDTTYARLHYALGQLYFKANRLREAVDAYRIALEIDPDLKFAHLAIGRVRALQGDWKTALHQASLEQHEQFRLYGLAIAHHVAGDEIAADAALRGLIEKSGGQMSYWIGSVYAFRGDADTAFDYLQHAFRKKDQGMLNIRTDPLLGPVRNDPRYAALLEGMRLD